MFFCILITLVTLHINLSLYPISQSPHYSIIPLFRYSIPPSLHYSIPPPLHYSIIPILHYSIPPIFQELPKLSYRKFTRTVYTCVFPVLSVLKIIFLPSGLNSGQGSEAPVDQLELCLNNIFVYFN